MKVYLLYEDEGHDDGWPPAYVCAVYANKEEAERVLAKRNARAERLKNIANKFRKTKATQRKRWWFCWAEGKKSWTLKEKEVIE